MITPTFYTFHGSPGTPYDFYPIEMIFIQAKWKGFIRYTQSMPEITHAKNEFPIAMGYSYGCIDALKVAAKNEEIKALVLISPYVHNTKTSLLKKLIAVAPGIGRKILEKKAPEAIDDFLIKSSYPDAPTEGYLKYGENLKNAKLLQASLWEKKDRDTEVLGYINQLKERKIPILILWGKEDQTSSYAEQIKPLVDRLPMAQLCEIQGGHALSYTQTAKVIENLADFCRSEIKKVFIGAKVRELQKKEEDEYDYLNPETPFGKYEGNHKLNNVSAFMYQHLKKNRKTSILSWAHPTHLEMWKNKELSLLPHSSISVEDLDYLVGKIAAGLKAQGIEKGDRIIIFIPMSLYLYSAMFAVQKIGAIAVFLDSWARRDQMGVAVDVVKPKAIISVERAFDYLDNIPQIKEIPIRIVAAAHEKKYTITLEELMLTDDYAQATPVESEHTALITFTTGSSGTPKGADRSHRFLASQHYALNRHLPYEKGDADLPAFPIFSLNNLAAGVTTVIPAFDVGTPSEDDAKIILEQFKQTKTTCTTLSPSLFRTLYNYCLDNEITLDEMKRIVTGGAPVGRDDIASMKKVAPSAEILVLYGSTEVEPMAHIEAEQMLREDPQDKDPKYVSDGVNVGRFDEGLEVKFIHIIKESLEIKEDSEWSKIEVPKGHVGEILVSGEHVCERYYNNPEATLKTKIRDHQGKIWHRTGDLGRLDEKGDLWLVGRVHNAINRAGSYIFPVRAEFVMNKSTKIKRAAYLGIQDETLGEKTVAVCEFDKSIAENENKTAEALKEVRELLDYNGIIVDHLISYHSIPMDARHHSKVEYKKLRESLKEEGLL